MLLNGWKRWLLAAGLVLVAISHSSAQYGQRTVSELDRLPVWYPLYRSSVAFQESVSTSPTAPTMYTDLADLLRKVKEGSKIESLVISGEVLKQGGLSNLRQLQTVRVLTLTGLTQQQADSVADAIQGWSLLEKLSVDLYQVNPNKPSAVEVAFPANW